MEEDLFAIVTANEAEASIADHLLDLALALGAVRYRRRAIARLRRPLATPATATAAARCAETIGGDELRAEEVERDREILQAVLLRGEQDLVVLRLDHAVTKARVLMRHK